MAVVGGDRRWEIRQPVAAGLRTIGATFLRESAKPEVALAGGRGAPRCRSPRRRAAPMHLPMAELDLRLDGAKLKRFQVPAGANPPQANGVTISGPYNITGPGNTPSRARIFVCHPAATPRKSRARKNPGRPGAPRLSPACYRRRSQAAAGFYRSGRAERDFDFGIEKALRAMLVSPDFLFRIEQDPPGARPAPSTGSAISSWRRGFRSSCGAAFPTTSCSIWRSKGKLKDPAVLDAAGAPACSTIRAPKRWCRTSPDSGCTCATSRS